MNDLHYTLLSDGPSDRALMPILTWLLCEHLPARAVQPDWPDLRRLPDPPKKVSARIQAALELSPCDLLFVHRDAEIASIDDRRTEIRNALTEARSGVTMPLGIAVIPVRMTEAWLLIDARAIREAAGNPNGTIQLDLPSLRDIESIADPKSLLHNLILEATELSARRKRRFDVHSAVQRIPEYIEDFGVLRRLSAFSALEEELVETIKQQAWDETSAP
ncbi:MAG: hypothetical protein JW741_01415 [Sedimentisphaerales bacterium]|nr:hypothetical protein [Sedimentisphaerales bacterium]